MVEEAPARSRSSSKFLAAIIALSAIGTAGVLVIALRRASLSPLTQYLWVLSIDLSLTGWVHEDRLAHGYKTPFEFDAFVFFAWPIVVPWYLCRTRGWRGLYVAAGLFALMIAPLVVGVFVAAWIVLH